MPSYKFNKISFLITISVILPFFDWTENIINIGGLFYFNIYKLCFLFFLLFGIKFSLEINKYNFYKILTVIVLSTIFLLWHKSFANLKGFFFVVCFFILYLIDLSKIPHNKKSIIRLLKFLIVFVFIFSLTEIILDIKFITPDFSDNHRNLLGVNLRRSSLTFQDPNYLAFHTGLIFLLLRHLSQENLNRYLIITILIIIFTGSRGALLAFFLAISYKYWINLMKFKYLVFTTIIVLLLYNFFYFDDIKNFEINEIGAIYLDTSPDTRTIMTRVVLNISALITIYNFPIFGIGHGQISTYGKSEMLPITLPNDVLEVIDKMGFHNYFLEFAVENGLIFFIFFLYIFKRAHDKKPNITVFIFLFLCTSGYESPLTFLLLIL